jgi:hypothetical protein
MHTADSEPYQKCSQTGCHERSKSVDVASVKHFSNANYIYGVHGIYKHQKSVGRNCPSHARSLRCAHSLNDLPALEYPVVDYQGLSSPFTLPEPGCCINLNDLKLHGVGSDEVFEKHDFKYAKLAEPVRTFTANSAVSSDLKTGANCGTPSPLSSLRLQPTRHHTKSAILSILESGEVCIEFLRKKRGNREDRVVDVCRISGDGLRVSNV